MDNWLVSESGEIIVDDHERSGGGGGARDIEWTREFDVGRISKTALWVYGFSGGVFVSWSVSFAFLSQAVFLLGESVA